VIGGSAGAVEALTRLVRALPADFPAAVLVVIHFPASAATTLPAILGRAGPLPACLAMPDTPVQPGMVYVGPPNCHMMLEHGRIRLSRGPKENGHRPAIDALFRTAASSAGPNAIGVLLSGNLYDGSLGLLRIKQRGGVTIVQDPADAMYAGMPTNAIERVEVDHIVTMKDLPALLVRLVGEPAQDAVQEEGDRMGDRSLEPAAESPIEHEVVQADRHVQPGTPSTQTCPECHGTLWEHEESGVTQFRCRIGHAFSAESLVAIQAEELEAALWTALRALEEHAALERRMAVRAASNHHSRTAAAFTEQALDAEHHAAVIRNVLENLKTFDTLNHTGGAGAKAS
jgi:two-component system chemotaxis response regulator CheB